MLQTMLAERFKLTIHHEQKVRPVYVLVLGKGPLKLSEPAGVADPAQQGCNGGRGGHHACKNMTMEDLATNLTQIANLSAMSPSGTMPWGIDRPVVDETGIKGAYDLTMDYGPMGGRRGGAQAADGVVTEISIVDAIKDLGLTLRPGKQPFDILVIEHLERVPTEN
jgi:uncharacterized protein (TIGR03435 family)